MSTRPIALIFGAGPRVGASVAAKFAAIGYAVALTSRSGTNAMNEHGHLHIKADLTQPFSVTLVFEAVKKEFNASPSVVVYNAARRTLPPDAESVLSVPLNEFMYDLNVNTVSPYLAAQQAIQAWDAGDAPEGKKTFIYTGNALNTLVAPNPIFLDLGVGKSGSAYWIGTAAALYEVKGYKFYFTDERQANGAPRGNDIDGDAHADFYEQLAEHIEGVPWHATFVKGKGYAKF